MVELGIGFRTSQEWIAWTLSAARTLLPLTYLRQPAGTSRASPGTKAHPLASSADATHNLLPLGFSACKFFVHQLLLARGSRIVELPLSSFVFNRGCCG